MMRKIICFTGVLCAAVIALAGQPIRSIDTGFTIMKVRDAAEKGSPFLVGGSYEGTILRVGYDGKTAWKNPLSGYMIHDIWCEDITGDGADEILVANADGALYCLDAGGRELWKFLPNQGGQLPPMYAVCVIHDKNKIPYVVCGGLDQSFYYLSAAGGMIKEVPSSGYSSIKPFGRDKAVLPPANCHTVNFLRPIPQPDGSDVLAVHALNNHMQSTGYIYQFKPLADKPFGSAPKVKAASVIGEFHVCDPDGDGAYEILLGTSALGDQSVTRFDPAGGKMTVYPLKKTEGNGYRVSQATTIADGDSFVYFMLCGIEIKLVPPDLDVTREQRIHGTYAYNDMWKDAAGRILLASSQSGGSCIHVIDPQNDGWKEAFSKLNPPGKIKTILANAAAARKELHSFKKPSKQRDSVPVYLTWAKSAKKGNPELVESLSSTYDNPVFLNSCGCDKENWDRSAMASELYKNKRDKRMNYTLTQQQVLDKLLPNYKNAPGIAYWVGHGNDPYMYQLETTKKVLDAANGKKTVLILPELGATSGPGEFVMHDLFYPLAAYCAEKNGNILFRSKNIFWQGDVYLPEWHDVLSGKYAGAVVPSMEETTDKTMDLSLAGRMGLWAAGSVDNWSMRCSRDNPSFDRCRQHSFQQLPNHFLRTMVYSMANGASYLNNTYVDMDHMGLALELVARGALYVPKREEIVSFSPVHLGMKEPDAHYILDGTVHKWTTFYDREFEENNPFVFGRLNDSWPAAPVTPWDFSRYASGVIDRRQNFIPPYPNGMVLITPPQEGVFAEPDAPRGKLVDHLHPLYRDIVKEYITDGRNYYSADGKQTFAADAYYKQVAADIQQSTQKLPLTVSGDVAWVCAQIAPKRLRLTLVDSGYLNPKARTAIVSFHAVKPVKMTNILTRKRLDLSDPSAVSVEVPLGLFSFVDIEVESMP